MGAMDYELAMFIGIGFLAQIVDGAMAASVAGYLIRVMPPSLAMVLVGTVVGSLGIVDLVRMVA